MNVDYIQDNGYNRSRLKVGSRRFRQQVFSGKGIYRMNIYVGNIMFDVSEAMLRQAFEEFGQVTEVRLIMDKYSGKSKGFGFIEMPDEAEAKKAMAEMNGKEFMGRVLNVNEARPRVDRGSGGRRGGRGGGGGGRGRS